jgi:hypothetical protein
MQTMRRFLVCLTLGAAISIGCGGSSDAPKAEPISEAEPAQTTGAGTGAAEDQDGVPKIVAENATHDFGGIKASDTVEHVFTVRNEGTADLKIDRVQRT